MAKKTQLLVDIGKNLSLLVGLPTIAYWNNSNRPKNPRRGTFGFNTETSSLEYWDGDTWFVSVMTKA